MNIEILILNMFLSFILLFINIKIVFIVKYIGFQLFSNFKIIHIL